MSTASRRPGPFAKKAVSLFLPRLLRRGPFREFRHAEGYFWRLPADSCRRSGKAGAWPIHDVWEALGDIFSHHVIEDVLRKAGESTPCARKIQALQAVALRLRE